MKAFLFIAACLLVLVAISEPAAVTPAPVVSHPGVPKPDKPVPADDCLCLHSDLKRCPCKAGEKMPSPITGLEVGCFCRLDGDCPCKVTPTVQPQAPPQEAPVVLRPAPVSAPRLPVQSGGVKSSSRAGASVARSPVASRGGYWSTRRYGFRGRRSQRVWVSTQQQRTYSRGQVQAYCPPGAGT